jgi:hypothetical protein
MEQATPDVADMDVAETQSKPPFLHNLSWKGYVNLCGSTLINKGKPECVLKTPATPRLARSRCYSD